MNAETAHQIYWPPSGLKRALIVSFVLHLVFFVSVTIFGGPRYRVPKSSQVIPVSLVGLPAPPPGQMKRRETIPSPSPTVAPAPKPTPAIKKPDPARPDPTKVPAKAPVKAPARVPPVAAKTGREEAAPARNKVGSADSSNVQRSELPAVGNMRGWMQTRVDGPITPWSYYIEILQTKVSSYWEPPAGLATATGETAAVIYFRIEKNGSLQNHFVEEPSGQALFDDLALRAVERSAPFPPLPPDYEGDYLIFHLRFVYAP